MSHPPPDISVVHSTPRTTALATVVQVWFRLSQTLLSPSRLGARCVGEREASGCMMRRRDIHASSL